MQIPFIYDFRHYYKVFKRYTGNKLYILIAIIIAGGLTEGVGIALFIPLLAQFSRTTAKDDIITIYIHKFLDFMHIQPTFNSILVLIVVIFLVKAVVILIQEALSAFISSSLSKELRYKMISVYTDMNYMYYLNSNVGYLNNIITTEIRRAIGAFTMYCTSIGAFLYILIYFMIALMIGWQVSILALFSGTLLIFSFHFLNNLSRHYSILTSNKNASLQEFLIQIIQFFKYLKATNSVRKIRTKLEKDIKLLADYHFKLGLFGGILKSVKEPFIIILMAGLILFQVSLMGKTVGAIMAIILLFYRLTMKVSSLQFTWQKFNAVVGGLNTFLAAFEEISKNLEIKGTKKVNKFIKGIRLKNVNFSFTDKQVLFDINMTIPKNQVTAIVGESGSGKSTIADLITGILRPRTGSIYFDNIDYKELDLEGLRLLIGYVTQENVTFHDSIANNISLWKWEDSDSATQSKVDKAARDAYCHKFVQNTESGYHTIIGDRGIKLSGGQRQRLSIARELFKEPEILILDEATSSLDSDSESFIQKSIAGLRGAKTIIIIAHRLSTIRSCDYVYLMNEGRIIEKGTYDELYNGNTKFKRMCLAQEV